MGNKTFYWDGLLQNTVFTKGFRVGMVPKLHHLRFFKPVHMDLTIAKRRFFFHKQQANLFYFLKVFFRKAENLLQPEICAQSKTIPLESFPEHPNTTVDCTSSGHFAALKRKRPSLFVPHVPGCHFTITLSLMG